jgi:hypothetical protein
MLSRIFPRQFDNAYRGHRFGFWLFVPIVLMELSMGANSLFNTRTVVMVLHVGSKALLLVHPVARSGVSSAQLGSAFILVLLSMLLVGFVLSLLNKRAAPA